MTTSSWIYSESELINFKLISHFLLSDNNRRIPRDGFKQLLWATILTNLYTTHAIKCIILCGKWLITSTFLCFHCCFRFSLGSSLKIYSILPFLSYQFNTSSNFFWKKIRTIDVAIVWLICNRHTNTLPRATHVSHIDLMNQIWNFVGKKMSQMLHV